MVERRMNMETTNIITRYYKVTNHHKITHLKMELYYSKGGMNYFTSKVESRGYYMSISPVERKNGMESYTGFSGLKRCILETQRKSKKKEDEAVDYFNGNILTFKNSHFSEYEIDIENCEVR
jgi:hypothetical protein